MLFDSHKFKVWLQMAITAMVGGAIAAISSSIIDPLHFNWFDVNGLKDLGKAAIGGAFTGLLFLFQTLPRNPATFQRRDDEKKIVEAAAKLGIVEPPRLARARRQADAKLQEIAAKQAEPCPPSKDGGGS